MFEVNGIYVVISNVQINQANKSNFKMRRCNKQDNRWT